MMVYDCSKIWHLTNDESPDSVLLLSRAGSNSKE